MTASAYLRVSSKTQDFPTQRAAIERAAAARGDTVTTWYSEKRFGKTLARPELDRLGPRLGPASSGACTCSAWTA